jgi:hypothetical protein
MEWADTLLHAAGSPIFKTDNEAEAVDRLKDLIHKHGKWIEPAPQTAAFGTVS